MVPSKVCQLLEKVGCDDVYEFLACERSAPLEELREAADAKYRQIHNQSSSTDAQKAARDLAGLCKAAIFMDAASKRAYDEETDTRRKPEGGVVSAVVAAVVVVAVVVGAAWMVWQGAVWVVDRVEGWVSRPVEEGPVEPPAPLPMILPTRNRKRNRKMDRRPRSDGSVSIGLPEHECRSRCRRGITISVRPTGCWASAAGMPSGLGSGTAILR